MNSTETENASVKVWDWPVRVFHWTLAASVLGAYFTGESEDFERLHHTLGWVAAGLIAFRVVWGLSAHDVHGSANLCAGRHKCGHI